MLPRPPRSFIRGCAAYSRQQEPQPEVPGPTQFLQCNPSFFGDNQLFHNQQALVGDILMGENMRIGSARPRTDT